MMPCQDTDEAAEEEGEEVGEDRPTCTVCLNMVTERNQSGAVETRGLDLTECFPQLLAYTWTPYEFILLGIRLTSPTHIDCGV